MIDTIRKSTIIVYRRLCKNFKVNNYQKEVFMANAIEIMGKMEIRMNSLEDQIKKLKK